MKPNLVKVVDLLFLAAYVTICVTFAYLVYQFATI